MLFSGGTLRNDMHPKVLTFNCSGLFALFVKESNKITSNKNIMKRLMAEWRVDLDIDVWSVEDMPNYAFVFCKWFTHFRLILSAQLIGPLITICCTIHWRMKTQNQWNEDTKSQTHPKYYFVYINGYVVLNLVVNPEIIWQNTNFVQSINLNVVNY